MISIYNEDCLQGLLRLSDSSIDLVFADLPYGRTQNDWDRIIPMAELWPLLARVCKETAPMVFTAMQPFTSYLVCSKPEWFRYEMIWKKNKASGGLNAKKQPLRAHENVLVFYRKQPPYKPQMTDGHRPANAAPKRGVPSSCYGAQRDVAYAGGQTTRYPTTVLDIPVVNNDDPNRVHPNQKPEPLPAWFIRTYTEPGDTVLDPSAGSGSTLFAADALGRHAIGFESDAGYFESIRSRITSRSETDLDGSLSIGA